MNDDVLGALDGIKGLLDDVGAGLGQDLDPHIVGDHVLLDDGAQELVLGLGSGRETNLDLLKAQLQQELVEGDLLLQAHGGDEGLVAVAQVHAAPVGSLGDALLLYPIHTSLRGHVVPGTILGVILHMRVILSNYQNRRKKVHIAKKLRLFGCSKNPKRRRQQFLRGTTLIGV